MLSASSMTSIQSLPNSCDYIKISLPPKNVECFFHDLYSKFTKLFLGPPTRNECNKLAPFRLLLSRSQRQWPHLEIILYDDSNSFIHSQEVQVLGLALKSSLHSQTWQHLVPYVTSHGSSREQSLQSAKINTSEGCGMWWPVSCEPDSGPAARLCRWNFPAAHAQLSPTPQKQESRPIKQ